jgi:FkbM family methyltransferase
MEGSVGGVTQAATDAEATQDVRSAGQRLRDWAKPLLGERGPIPGPSPGMLFDLAHLRDQPRVQNEAAIRLLCRNAYLGRSTALCRVLGRYKMYVDTMDIGLSSHLLIDGYWEMWVTEAMLSFLRAPMVAIDVGANLGYYTMLMADLVGPAGRVHAFEPNPLIRQRLAHSVAVNGYGGRTTVHGEPLSDRAGETVRLIVPEGEPKNAHILPDGPDATGLTLQTTTIDALVGDGPVDFIKIDAEGAELAIWHGMRRLLDRRQSLAIFLEFNPARYADAAGFLTGIRAQGFNVAVIDPQEGVVPVSDASILEAAGREDWMLVLAR